MELAWIITHLNSTGDEIINVCLSFASSWHCTANKRQKALSEPNAPHTANKRTPVLIPDEVIFTPIARKWLSVVVISQAWDQQEWPLKPHCKPFRHWWLFPIKQNWGKRREANKSPGGLQPIYLAPLLSSEVISGEKQWRKSLLISHLAAWWELPGSKLLVWPLFSRVLQHARVVTAHTYAHTCKDCPQCAYFLCSRWRKS